jgi:hypothetical protein
MKTCKYCGKEFEYIRPSQKYCSNECRKHVKYERDRAWLNARPGKAAEYSRNWYHANIEIGRQSGRDAYRKKCLAKIEAERDNNGGK